VISPSRAFILRPVATSLLMVAILLLGIVAVVQLPISALPQVDYPTIQVVTFYPGASPEVTSTTVTAPLERQFGQVPGLQQMTSTSGDGVSVIVLQFALTLDIDVAEQEVQAAINASERLLPANLPIPPIYSKTNPADPPVLTLAVTSTTLPLSKVEDLVDTRLAPKLSQLSGVGIVQISGGQKPAVRIQANPVALSSYGIDLESLRTALVQTSVNAAKGSFDGPRQAYQIDANDQLQTSTDYRQVVVAYRDGSPVRLTDVAKVVDGVENTQQAAWMNTTPAVIVNIQRQPGANTIAVVAAIEALLPQLQVNLPADLHVTTLTDLTVGIKASVKAVAEELALTIGLVVLVIFVFLRSAKATLIPSVAVPLSLVGTFAVMYALGFSLDNLSLMALTIATGFVVDDAIVMIENVSRFLEAGKSPRDAALEGAAQIGFTIISLTVSLIAVLIPLLFMGDVVGRLFREFAVTLAVTIAISAVVSLTLTPMMCAKILRHDPKAQQGRVFRWSERMFERMIAFYGRTLTVVLRHRTITLIVAAVTLVLTILLYIVIPKGFLPVQDTGVIQGISQAPPTTSFTAMADYQQRLAKVILADPAVDSVSSFIGVDGVNTAPNSGRFSINLKPLDDRGGVRAPAIIRRLAPALARAVPDVALYLQPVQNITVEDRATRTQYQYTLETPDPDELAIWTTKFVDRVQQLPQLVDVATDQQPGGLATELTIDRITASRLGITPSAIENALYDAFGQRQINTMYTQSNQYHVVLEVEPRFQQGPDQLSSIYLQAGAGSSATALAAAASAAAGTTALTSSPLLTPTAASTLLAAVATPLGTPSQSTVPAASTQLASAVPLSAVAKATPTTHPLAIVHQGQFPAVTVSFNLAPGASLGDAIDEVDAVAKDLHFPASVQAGFQGTAASFRASLTNEPLLVLAALLAVYIVLGVLYESFIHPLTILSTLPSAGVGALLALMLFGEDLDVIAIIGIILLIGIVKKNGIMIVDFALEAQREHGKSPVEAAYEAAVLRFRPIMMTTMAALFGGLPLALGSGLGAELRRPLGIAMVGGLLLSQVLTLYTTPVIYVFFDGLSQRFKRWRGAAAPATDARP
jgi:multidrug efflux pump